MWKVIYIATDILLARNLEKILKEKGIVTILNQLEVGKDELYIIYNIAYSGQRSAYSKTSV
jgi:hypothetical protein